MMAVAKLRLTIQWENEEGVVALAHARAIVREMREEMPWSDDLTEIEESLDKAIDLVEVVAR